MTVEDRRSHEHALIDLYAKTLEHSGGPGFTRNELWGRNREAVPYSYVTALTTAGLGGMQEESVALEGLRRAVTALRDLESVAALRRLL